METFEINNRRYLGSKYKLTEFIKKIVNDNCLDYESFFDVFAGTGIVGSAFNKENIKVIVNDLLLSNFYSYNVWFSNEDFRLSKIVEIIYYYNSLILVEDNYFSLNFSNTYFSKNVCRKIGFIRE
ncbi:MAG: DNA adenine methylase, partial [Clostridiales bacterium]